MDTSPRHIPFWQKIVILSFSVIVVLELITFLKWFIWLIKYNNLLNINYIYIPVHIILDLLGLYGLFSIFKYKRYGFYLFYTAFLSSTLIDSFQSGSLPEFIFVLFGNIILFIIFYLSTKNIFNQSTR